MRNESNDSTHRIRPPFVFRPRFARARAALSLTGSLALAAMVWGASGCALLHPEFRSSRSPGTPTTLPLTEPGIVSTTLGEVEAVESSATRVRFRIAAIPPSGSRRTVVLALALPPDREPTARIVSCRLRQTAPWDTEVLDDEETAALLSETAPLDSLVTVSLRGVARATHLYQFVLSPELQGSPSGFRHRLTEAEVVVEWDAPWPPAAALPGDFAYDDPNGPWMRTLGGLVVNPTALRAYADPAPPPAAIEPAHAVPAWQPEPFEGSSLPWLKIPVVEEGLYAIDWHTLHNAGWDPDAIEPSRLRLVAEGSEVPTLLLGGLAARFTIRDRILFRGRPSPSPTTRENAYFLGLTAPEAPPPLRMADPPPLRSGEHATNVDRWPMVTRIEKDLQLETKEGSFLSIQEMRHVWQVIPRDTPLTLDFDLPGHVEPLDDKHGPHYLRVHCYVGKGGQLPNADLEATLNDTVSGKTRISGHQTDPTLVVEVPRDALREKGNRLVLVWKGDATMVPLWLDAIEVSHWRRLDVAHGPMLLDRGTNTRTGTLALQVEGAKANDLLALDLSDPDHPRRLTLARMLENESYRVLVPEGTTGRLGLFPVSRTPTSPPGHLSPWRPWKTETPEADAVLVTHGDFLDAAESLAALWRAEGRRPLVVDVESLYDAYTAGLLDPAAIKLFLRDAMERWPRRPEVVLLIGDCTSDYRNEARNNVVNYVPSYSHPARGLAGHSSFASDHWFTQTHGDDEIGDFLLGRLSVASPEDARVVVAKQRQARAFPGGLWGRTVGLVADHGNFLDVCEELRERILPPTVLPRLAYLDREPFEDNFYLPSELLQGDEVKVSPATTRRIQSLFEDGTSVIAFFGHGSPNIWSDQRIWFGGDTPNSDNRRLRNSPRYPLVFNGTCNTGAIDYPVRPWNICISEDMMRQPEGGALACFVPSAPGFTSNHRTLAEALLRAAYTLDIRQVGPLCELARLTYQIAEARDDHSRMFILLGDPLASLPPAPAAEGHLVVEPDAWRLHPPATAGRKHEPAPVDFSDPDTHVLGPDGTPVRQGDEPRQGRVVALRHEPDGQTLGAAAFLGPASVTLRTLQPFSPTGALAQRLDHPPPTFLAGIENASDVPAEGEVELLALSREGKWDRVATTAFALAARERRTVPFHLDLPVGAHGLRLGLVESPAVTLSATEPPAPLVRVVADPEVPADIALLLLSATPTGTVEGGVALHIQTALANLGAKPWGGGEVRIVESEDPPRSPNDDGGAPLPARTVVASRIVGGTVQPGQSTLVTFSNVSIPAGETVRWTLEAETHAPEWPDADPTNNRAALEFDAALLPDIAFVPDSLLPTPPSPTEGETVFLKAELENRGPSESPEFTVTGIAIDKNGKETPMRDAAHPRDSVHVRLAPGERRPVRVRWDPRDNLEIVRVALVADAGWKVADPDRKNNRIEAPIHVRSKWKLVPLGIDIADRTDDSVTLVARIRNEGETPARYVEAAFYPDEDRRRENRLGVVLHDLVEPNETKEFRFLWTMRPEDVGRQVRPSYEAYIKGSLLRVAGTTGD